MQFYQKIHDVYLFDHMLIFCTVFKGMKEMIQYLFERLPKLGLTASRE